MLPFRMIRSRHIRQVCLSRMIRSRHVIFGSLWKTLWTENKLITFLKPNLPVSFKSERSLEKRFKIGASVNVKMSWYEDREWVKTLTWVLMEKRTYFAQCTVCMHLALCVCYFAVDGVVHICVSVFHFSPGCCVLTFYFVSFMYLLI